MKYRYDCYELNKREKLICCIGLIVFLGIIGIFFYRTILSVGFTPFFFPVAVRLYGRYQNEKRRKEILVQFRDFLYSLSSSFSSGRQMGAAMEEALESLKNIYGNQSIMASELKQMIFEMKEAGKSDLQVIVEFGERTGIEDIVSFASVFRACRSTGGDMVKAVTGASDILGEKIEIENQIDSIYVQKKLEGGIILAMPFLIIGFLNISSPEYILPLYSTFAGRILMTACICIMIFAYFTIRKIMSIEI